MILWLVSAHLLSSAVGLKREWDSSAQRVNNLTKLTKSLHRRSARLGQCTKSLPNWDAGTG